MNPHLLLLTLLIFLGCQDNDSNKELLFTYDFEKSLDSWTGDFADYPVNDSSFYELFFGFSPLPPELNTQRKGIKISGNNHSDDLFMFMKRKIDGLQPNTSYYITFYLNMASNAPAGASGIGGSPGESVYLKVGATVNEPQKTNDGSGFYRMNIDKGNQSEGGRDMHVIGNIAASETATGYELIMRDDEPKVYDSHLPYSVKTGNTGTLWLIVGTDSGFEGTTTLYYDQIQVKMKPL